MSICATNIWRMKFTWITLMFAALPACTSAAELSATLYPERPSLITSAGGVYLSADVEIRNPTERDLQLVLWEISVFDTAGTRVYWRRLEANGSRPGLETAGPRHLPAGGSAWLFNPVTQLPADLDVARVAWSLGYSDGSGARSSVALSFVPATEPETPQLLLPLAGHVWVYDGFDPVSHHRRLDLSDEFNRGVIGMKANSQRYAVDLVAVDGEGRVFTGSAGDPANWVGWGANVRAPADGIVVGLENDIPDVLAFDAAKLEDNPLLMLGNYVLIRHEGGVHSLLAHFRRGSVHVAPGERISQGASLGAMGRSGMGVGLVHLHFELRDSADLLDSEGVPARFEGVEGADAGGLLRSGTFLTAHGSNSK